MSSMIPFEFLSNLFELSSNAVTRDSKDLLLAVELVRAKERREATGEEKAQIRRVPSLADGKMEYEKIRCINGFLITVYVS